jgi:hypothetical protein
MTEEIAMAYWNTVRQRFNSLLGHFEGFELVVNGVALTPAQIAAFQRLTGQAVVEPGRYWFDAATGAMGMEGSAWPVYQLYARAQAPLGGRRSLSERRSLFSQADLTGVCRVGAG